MLYQLWALWNKVDPRYLSIRLLSASGLPAMDGEGGAGTTDAYVVAYIVPPDPDLPTSPLQARTSAAAARHAVSPAACNAAPSLRPLAPPPRPAFPAGQRVVCTRATA